MKKILILSFIFVAALFSLSHAASWWTPESDPFQVLESVKDTANEKPDSRIQDTALDEIEDRWWYARQYKIANTLDYLRESIYPYLQWIVYIWLVAAVILIIYNWFLMVTNGIHNQWDMAKVKKNLMNIVIWVILLTWFYFIIRLMLAILTSLFGKY